MCMSQNVGHSAGARPNGGGIPLILIDIPPIDIPGDGALPDADHDGVGFPIEMVMEVIEEVLTEVQ